MNVIGNPVVSGLSAYVTVALPVISSIVGEIDEKKSEQEAQVAYANELYRMLDAMDSVYGLYSNAQERENTINAALSIIGEKIKMLT